MVMQTTTTLITGLRSWYALRVRDISEIFFFSFFLLLDIPEGTCKQDTELTVLINNLYNNQQKCSPCVLRCFHLVFCIFCFFGTLCFTNYTLAGIDLFLLTSMILVLGLNIKVQSILKIILKMFSSHTSIFSFYLRKEKQNSNSLSQQQDSTTRDGSPKGSSD